MKKMLFGFLLGIIFLSICNFTYYNVKNAPGSIKLCEYKLNRHLYVTATQNHWYSGVGIIHSPNCKCNKK